MKVLFLSTRGRKFRSNHVNVFCGVLFSLSSSLALFSLFYELFGCCWFALHVFNPYLRSIQLLTSGIRGLLLNCLIAHVKKCTTNFEIEKFNRDVNFGLWQVKMHGFLIQNGLKKAILRKEMKPSTMKKEHWKKLDENALTMIQLSVSNELLREIVHEESAASTWRKFESLYMTKSLVSHLHLKQCFVKMAMSKLMMRTKLCYFYALFNHPSRIFRRLLSMGKTQFL